METKRIDVKKMRDEVKQEERMLYLEGEAVALNEKLTRLESSFLDHLEQHLFPQVVKDKTDG